MLCFPMFMKLERRTVLVCGTGRQALEKIRRLQPFGPRILAVTPQPTEELEALEIPILRHRFSETDLDLQPVFVVAVESREENHRIAGLCRAKGIAVNAVDQPEDCDFLFPALITREPLTVGICTAGASPSAAVALKKRVQDQIPENIGEILVWLAEMRPRIGEICGSKAQEKQLLATMVEEAFQRDRPLTEEEISVLVSFGYRNQE